jgi:4-hydroxybenzoate polyprenyltransferase
MRLLQPYRLINILSLDVVAGSVCCAIYFSQIFQVRILPYGLVALGLTVWIIYTTDHLRDARKIGRAASSDRHRFHQQFATPLLVLMILALVADVAMLFFIRTQVFIWGAGLTIFVALYLALHRRIFYLKEIFVALMYTIGVLLPSIAVTSSRLSWVQAGLIIQFFLLALLNLLVFSLYDAEIDSKDNLSSFVTYFGKPAAERIIKIIFGLAIILNVVQVIFAGDRLHVLILTSMIVVMLLVFSFPRVFARNDYFRLLGDSVFLFPAIALL